MIRKIKKRCCSFEQIYTTKCLSWGTEEKLSGEWRKITSRQVAWYEKKSTVAVGCEKEYCRRVISARCDCCYAQKCMNGKAVRGVEGAMWSRSCLLFSPPWALRHDFVNSSFPISTHPFKTPLCVQYIKFQHEFYLCLWGKPISIVFRWASPWGLQRIWTWRVVKIRKLLGSTCTWGII